MLDFILQKASTGVNPYYLDIWMPAHQGAYDAAKKLVSTNFYMYSSFVISKLT
jgi:hypothetical protein